MRTTHITLLLLVSMCTSGDGSSRLQAEEEANFHQLSLSQYCAFLSHPDGRMTRYAAASAVAEYGVQAVPYLCEILESGDALARSYSCELLSVIGPQAEEAIPLLLRIASDPSDASRCEAITALGRIGAPEHLAVPILCAALHENHTNVRLEAIQSLALYQTPEAIGALLPLVCDRNRQIQIATMRVFRGLGCRAHAVAPALLELTATTSDERIRREAFWTMKALGRRGVVALLPLLSHNRPEIRYRTAMVFSRLGAKAEPAVAALRPALQDAEPLVRFWAARALGSIGEAAASECDNLVPLLGDPDADVRWEAATALAQIGLKPNSAVFVSRLLNDPHPAVRRQAQRTLTLPGAARDPAVASN